MLRNLEAEEKLNTKKSTGLYYGSCDRKMGAYAPENS